MNIGNKIAYYRKKMNITQETLAQALGVTNQAVSKWELDQACPDIQLLPALADFFGVTIDSLFGRESFPTQQELPKKGIFGMSFDDLFTKEPTETEIQRDWENDDTLRVVLYRGFRPVKDVPAGEKLIFEYSGPALNIDSAVNVVCGDVAGSVDAGGKISCGNVGGDVDAGSDVKCGNVSGNVDAGSCVYCGDVGGDVDAGGSVSCGRIQGDVDAGGSVTTQK